MEQDHRDACRYLLEKLPPVGQMEKESLDLFVQIFWENNPTYEDYLYVFIDKRDRYYKSQQDWDNKRQLFKLHREERERLKDRI